MPNTDGGGLYGPIAKQREAERQESHQAVTFSGVEKFQKAIEAARLDQRERFRNPCGLALDLESQELATLSTRV